jgi:hypothetical protein
LLLASDHDKSTYFQVTGRLPIASSALSGVHGIWGALQLIHPRHAYMRQWRSSSGGAQVMVWRSSSRADVKITSCGRFRSHYEHCSKFKSAKARIIVSRKERSRLSLIIDIFRSYNCIFLALRACNRYHSICPHIEALYASKFEVREYYPKEAWDVDLGVRITNGDWWGVGTAHWHRHFRVISNKGGWILLL